MNLAKQDRCAACQDPSDAPTKEVMLYSQIPSPGVRLFKLHDKCDSALRQMDRDLRKLYIAAGLIKPATV